MARTTIRNTPAIPVYTINEEVSATNLATSSKQDQQTELLNNVDAKLLSLNNLLDSIQTYLLNSSSSVNLEEITTLLTGIDTSINTLLDNLVSLLIINESIDTKLDGLNLTIDLTSITDILTTINTKLDSLNLDIDLTTITTPLNSIDTKLDSLNLDIDLTSITDLLTTINTTLTDLLTELDTIASNIGTTNTKLDTVNTNLSTIHTDITSSNTKLDTVNTKLDTINTTLGASGSVSVTQPINDFLKVITTNIPYGYSVNDLIIRTRWFDTSTNPPTLLSTKYYNTNTNTILTSITLDEVEPSTYILRPVYTSYIANTNAAQYNSNDVITQINWYSNNKTTPTLVTTTYYNNTQNAVITSYTANHFTPSSSTTNSYTNVSELLRANTTNSSYYTINDRIIRTRFYNASTLVATVYYNSTTATVITSYTVSHFSLFTNGVIPSIESYSNSIAANSNATILLDEDVNKICVFNTGTITLQFEIVGATSTVNGNGYFYIPMQQYFEFDFPSAIITSIKVTNSSMITAGTYILTAIRTK